MRFKIMVHNGVPKSHAIPRGVPMQCPTARTVCQTPVALHHLSASCLSLSLSPSLSFLLSLSFPSFSRSLPPSHLSLSLSLPLSLSASLRSCLALICFSSLPLSCLFRLPLSLSLSCLLRFSPSLHLPLQFLYSQGVLEDYVSLGSSSGISPVSSRERLEPSSCSLGVAIAYRLQMCSKNEPKLVQNVVLNVVPLPMGCGRSWLPSPAFVFASHCSRLLFCTCFESCCSLLFLHVSVAIGTFVSTS